MSEAGPWAAAPPRYVYYEVEGYYRDVRGWSMGGSTTQVCINRIAHEILKNLKGWKTGRQGSWNAGKH